jgi:hypothetical protein
MATATTKLPMREVPILGEELGAAVEALLEPYEGKKLDKAQAAVRRTAASGVTGMFDEIVAAYEAAIRAAVGDKES